MRKTNFYLPREFYTLFWLSSEMSSVKVQLHSDGKKGFLFYLGFVWRQSEFAFFGAWLRSRTFLFCGRVSVQPNSKRENVQLDKGDKHENLQDSLYSVCNSGILFSGRNR